jgi:transcriptional regulator with XRE-family HTH domain
MQPESSEQTITRVLSRYEVGKKLRRLRLRKKLGLKELGRHTGLSASMLSQLENGRMVPTLQTLARIAMVFDVGLDHFFEQRAKTDVAVVRAAERIRFPERPDAPLPAYFFECLNFVAEGKAFQAYLAEFPRRAPRDDPGHLHESAEFIHVLEGEMVLRVDGEEQTLGAGDSVHFDGSQPHSYRGAGKHGARALVVTYPKKV